MLPESQSRSAEVQGDPPAKNGGVGAPPLLKGTNGITEFVRLKAGSFIIERLDLREHLGRQLPWKGWGRVREGMFWHWDAELGAD